MIHRPTFYAQYRQEFGPLLQPQVNGLNKILDFLDRDGLPLTWEAYVLATIYHECAATWQPIEERGQRSYFDKYEPGTKRGVALGNTQRGDGYRYRGRGYVQLTGRRNYAWASTLPLRVNFEATPEAACEPEFAWAILVAGCTAGAFTGRKLGDYLSPLKTPHYEDARRVINGLDRAAQIAGYAVKFDTILRLSTAVAPLAPAERVILGGNDPVALLVRAEAAEQRLATLKAAILALLEK